MSKRFDRLVERLERNQRIHEAEIQRRPTQAEYYEALEDGQTDDGRTPEDLGLEPKQDIQGDEL